MKKSLSPLENRVLQLYLDGNGYMDIARILGKTPKSIDNALQRIRGKIKSYFWRKLNTSFLLNIKVLK